MPRSSASKARLRRRVAHREGDAESRLQTAKAQFEDARKKLIDAIKARHKQVARAVKDLGKLKEERDAREQEVKLAAEREITHLREAAADLHAYLRERGRGRRYFTVVNRAEIEENEFNLNLPRYVDTFEPEKVLPLATPRRTWRGNRGRAKHAQTAVQSLLARCAA